MSRSNPSDLKNPADKFFEWSGSTGEVIYYDKSESKNISMTLPFTFLVLDRLCQVGGGTEVDGKWVGYWSNAVRNLSTQPLKVKSKRGDEVEGLYKDIKGHKGIKFVVGLYIAYKEGEELRIGHLKLTGSSLTPWIELTKKHDIFKGAYSITGSIPKKKGSTNYFEPIITHSPNVSEATNVIALELDKDLQEYLDKYLSGTKEVYSDPEWGGNDGMRSADEILDNFVPQSVLDKEDEFDKSVPF